MNGSGVRRTILNAMRRVCGGVLLLLLAALPAFLVGDAWSTEATFNKGSFSVGAGVGLALLRMEEVNDFLDSQDREKMSQFSELNQGLEVLGDVRYAVLDQFFIGLQGSYIRAETKDAISDSSLIVYGYPILLTAGYSMKPDDSLVFRFIGGMGVIVNGTLEFTGSGINLGGTGFAAEFGGEAEFRVFPAMGISVSGMVRTAMIEEAGVEPFILDLDFSGASFRAMIRGYFGGRKDDTGVD